jgi:hypothetical protein
MDNKLATRVSELLTAEGFADIHTESTDDSIALSARKDQVQAFFQIAEGVAAKGAPVTRYIAGPHAPVHDAETRAPAVRIPGLESHRP